MDLSNYYDLRNNANEINVPVEISGEDEGGYSKLVREIYREHGSMNNWKFIAFEQDMFVGYVNKNNEVKYFTCEFEWAPGMNRDFYCYFENQDEHFLVVNAREASNNLVHELNTYFA